MTEDRKIALKLDRSALDWLTGEGRPTECWCRRVAGTSAAGLNVKCEIDHAI